MRHITIWQQRNELDDFFDQLHGKDDSMEFREDSNWWVVFVVHESRATVAAESHNEDSDLIYWHL